MRWPFSLTKPSAPKPPKPPKAPLPHSSGLPHAWPMNAAALAATARLLSDSRGGAGGMGEGAGTADDDDLGALLLLACASCGRTDLPFVDGWPDLTCEECDEAINFDSLMEAGAFDDVL